MRIQTATAPSYWALYLIYDDCYHMTDDEIKEADAFANWLGGNIVSCEDAGFLNWHDARLQGFCEYAADCQEYTALIKEELE